MIKKPTNCKNHQNKKLCNKIILEMNAIPELHQGDNIHYLNPDEMLKQEKQSLEICAKCPNFLQKTAKL